MLTSDSKLTDEGKLELAGEGALATTSTVLELELAEATRSWQRWQQKKNACHRRRRGRGEQRGRRKSAGDECLYLS